MGLFSSSSSNRTQNFDQSTRVDTTNFVTELEDSTYVGDGSQVNYLDGGAIAAGRDISEASLDAVEYLGDEAFYLGGRAIDANTDTVREGFQLTSDLVNDGFGYGEDLFDSGLDFGRDSQEESRILVERSLDSVDDSVDAIRDNVVDSYTFSGGIVGESLDIVRDSIDAVTQGAEKATNAIMGSAQSVLDTTKTETSQTIDKVVQGVTVMGIIVGVALLASRLK